ncbi:MAG: FecR domain-containing protein [Deltaproteobacteria bacterium]|nr:FecR domain-containing protein [Deltaproteobacteria bacterium]
MRFELTDYDRGASNLGRIASRLDGSTSQTEDNAGRRRLLVALSAQRGLRRRWVAMTAVAALLIATALGAMLLQERPESIKYSLSGSSLQIENEWIAADRGSGWLRFSEGSEIKLIRGSKSRVAELTPHGARLVLASGMLRARVVHRPRARWQVGAGPYSIDVSGTAFDVDWSMRDSRLEVRLHDGSVLVRGPSLQQGIRLIAGQRLVASARTGRAELSTLAPTKDMEDPAVAPSSVAQPQSFAPLRPAPSWSELLTRGSFHAILSLAEARGIEATLRRGSLADIVALTDAARYTGERALARRGLLTQRARFARSAEARAAAFLLGRLADDQGESEQALRWYENYLQQSPRGAFAAEALGNRLVVLVRSGKANEARAAAIAYLRRFPRGAHAVYANEVLRGP